jgi:hypothetical protein
MNKNIGYNLEVLMMIVYAISFILVVFGGIYFSTSIPWIYGADALCTIIDKSNPYMCSRKYSYVCYTQTKIFWNTRKIKNQIKNVPKLGK